MKSVVGSMVLRRVGVVRFPVSELRYDVDDADEPPLARIGGGGTLRIFFGRGQRIELADGTRWKLTATASGGAIVPVIVASAGKLVMGTPLGKRAYGLNGRDFAYKLYPTQGGVIPGHWILREYETELAVVAQRSIRADHPVPLAAALLSLALVKHGIPGEADLGIPEFKWA